MAELPGLPVVAAPSTGSYVDGPERPVRHGEWAPGEVLVRFKSNASRQKKADAHSKVGARVKERIRSFGIDVVRLPDSLGVRAAVRRYSKLPSVGSAEPNYYAQPFDIPDDEKFKELWGLNNTGQRHLTARRGKRSRGKPDADIDVPRAWNVEEGDPSTVIAVVDTGVDIRHPELKDAIWTNPGEIPRDGIDNDGNGFVDDVHGWDVAENDNTLVERNQRVFAYSHGTHVAGTIGAEKDNERGIAGICPGCKIMVVKIAKPKGKGKGQAMSLKLSDELQGFAYAHEMGADIVNASFGRPFWLSSERRALGKLGRSGALTVAASGNSLTNLDILSPRVLSGETVRRGNRPAYPAAYDLPSLISVAASNDRDSFAFFTNYGADSVDVAAPGVDVLSTVPNKRYGIFVGTSMSAPHVAGVAGLVKSRFPSRSPEQIRLNIMRSVDKPRRMRSATQHNPNIATITQGRINAASALKASSAPFKRSDGNMRGARPLGRRASERIDRPLDANDVFSKNLKKGDHVTVSLRSRGLPLALYVWSPGTLEIWQLEEGCYDGGRGCKLVDWNTDDKKRKKLEFTAQRGGKFFVHVGGSQRDRGRYKLRLKRK